MKKKYSNPCIRCGTERIVSRVWKEKVGYSIVINTETICPNPDCQKKVESDNKKQQEKYTRMKLRSQERALNRNKTDKLAYRN